MSPSFGKIAMCPPLKSLWYLLLTKLNEFGLVLSLFNEFGKYYLWPIPMINPKADLINLEDGSQMGIILTWCLKTIDCAHGPDKKLSCIVEGGEETIQTKSLRLGKTSK